MLPLLYGARRRADDRRRDGAAQFRGRSVGLHSLFQVEDSDADIVRKYLRVRAVEQVPDADGGLHAGARRSGRAGLRALHRIGRRVLSGRLPYLRQGGQGVCGPFRGVPDRDVADQTFSGRRGAECRLHRPRRRPAQLSVAHRGLRRDGDRTARERHGMADGRSEPRGRRLVGARRQDRMGLVEQLGRLRRRFQVGHQYRNL